MSRKITELVYMDLDKLKKHPNNPRTIKNDSFKKLMTSIDENPDFFEARPIMVSDRTGELIIIGGNQRYAAAKELGFKHVPTVLLPALTEEKEQEIMIRDNIANGDWDFDMLANEWDAGLLNEWGLDVPDWDKETANAGLTDPDDVPEPEGNPVTVQGDLWVLGDHRLLCGDSTNKPTVDLLMNGQKADAVFTDPPYGMFLNADYSDMDSKFKGSKGGNKYKNVIGDHDDFKPQLITSVLDYFKDVNEVFLWGADYYSELLPDRNSGSWVVWDKRLDESADKMFGSCFELCWSKFRHKRTLARVKWAGIFGMEKEHDKKRVHPTQKPVELVEWFIESFLKKQNSIVDLYMGSGSTLIACEKSGKQCFGMELSESYCDVIIKRWQDFSGKIAVLESTGQTFEEVKAQRHG